MLHCSAGMTLIEVMVLIGGIGGVMLALPLALAGHPYLALAALVACVPLGAALGALAADWLIGGP